MSGEKIKFECGACDSTDLRIQGAIDYYVAQGTMRTDIMRCRQCGTWFRALDAAAQAARTHFDVASYTDPQNERRFREQRKDFFRYLYQICQRELRTSDDGRRLLDIGCSYAHMMDIFAGEGYNAAGVEIVATLREKARRKGYRVYPSYDEIPESELFDVIAMVDSLYCFDNPLTALRKLRDRLSEDGILLLRVANRTWIMNCLRFMRRPITSNVFGDSKFCFSYRGVRTLCERAGFRIEKIVLCEKGKRIESKLKYLLYASTPLISRLTRCTVTPGIILICRKMNPRPASAR